MLKLIAVIGGRECSDADEQIAWDVGKLIAANGYGLICGGRGGIMEAAARGCRDNGGTSIGILPEDDPASANPYIDIAIPTGMGIMRNLLIVRSAVGVIAIDGKYGTLSEIAYALQLGKPIVGINSWDVSESIIPAGSAEEAIEKLLKKVT